MEQQRKDAAKVEMSSNNRWLHARYMCRSRSRTARRDTRGDSQMLIHIVGTLRGQAIDGINMSIPLATASNSARRLRAHRRRAARRHRWHALPRLKAHIPVSFNSQAPDTVGTPQGGFDLYAIAQ
ncbi:MAG: hypothetical protein ACLU0O_04095 [Collinsella sp.]